MQREQSMREMGSFDLLTREGEVEIAKRIEAGLQACVLAISTAPSIIAEILACADKIGSGEMGIAEVVDGLTSAGEADDYVAEEDVDSFDDDGDDAAGGRATTRRLEELRVDALARFAVMRKGFAALRKAYQRDGYGSAAYGKAQRALSEQLMTVRFTVKTIDKLCRLQRSQVDEVRRLERDIRRIVVDKCGMPQQRFIEQFPPNGLNLGWLHAEVKAGRPDCAALGRHTATVQELQNKLVEL